MELFQRQPGVQTRWASFENPEAAKGQAATANRGAKGSPFAGVAAGETKTLLDARGSGTVRRIWMTLSDRSPNMLRAMRIDMYWDDTPTPAVSAPLGDFLGVGLGRHTPFCCDLFSDPEGRSFNCFIPMPFRTSARITLTNEGTRDLPYLFYDVNLLLDVPHDENTLYFHTHWRRERPNALGQDFTILPHVQGAGRFLGCNIGVSAHEAYEDSWWGEGECKMWLDGDGELPTICGSGTEDYIGTAWGQNAFANPTQGCPIADAAHHQWCFYRYHLPDPIFFSQDLRVALQTIGGSSRAMVSKLQQRGVPLIPVSIDAGGGGKFLGLMDRPQPVDLTDPSLPDGWCNFYRQDDWSAAAYFYLDQPENGLPPLAPVADRTIALLEDIDGSARADT